MALDVLLYSLLVLESALRCVLPKHKSSIQKRNHSVNDVGGQFLETLLMSRYIWLFALSSSVCRRTSCCGGSSRWRKYPKWDYSWFFYIHVRSHLK